MADLGILMEDFTGKGSMKRFCPFLYRLTFLTELVKHISNLLILRSNRDKTGIQLQRIYGLCQVHNPSIPHPARFP